jgi:hypothetical protein
MLPIIARNPITRNPTITQNIGLRVPTCLNVFAGGLNLNNQRPPFLGFRSCSFSLRFSRSSCLSSSVLDTVSTWRTALSNRSNSDLPGTWGGGNAWSKPLWESPSSPFPGTRWSAALHGNGSATTEHGSWPAASARACSGALPRDLNGGSCGGGELWRGPCLLKPNFLRNAQSRRRDSARRRLYAGQEKEGPSRQK